ncbi:putative periplasmic lipoprotein [Mucilaginibacter paludis]|uniref:Lipoprotein n=1 Tax=Mucilaginibacter paludis DSM 18603 TaxID=714943 RepID=H1Y9P1_9SPHI|nr:hypothetical protein [Mucilaginibacter paludis]EHQ30543.1 hypothetical protein Mucpa_6490 [Mucilaginibacter paludis DSM 18603]
MKKILITAAFAVTLAGCSNRPQQNNVSISNNTTAGFDVNKLGDIVKTSTDPQVLEKAINAPNNNINNLDLDKDGKIDYLKVTEPGKNELAIVDDISKDQSVTVANIKVDPTNNNSADLNIQGNPSYVGDNYMYHSHFSFTDFLLLSYLMRPHSYYVPMYHYGYYPSYYSSRRVVTNYRPTTSSAVSSPRRSSLSGSGSQRSFGTRNTSQRVRSGGFGNSSSRSSSFGSGSSSRRSFGSSRSFGRRR